MAIVIKCEARHFHSAQMKCDSWINFNPAYLAFNATQYHFRDTVEASNQRNRIDLMFYYLFYLPYCSPLCSIALEYHLIIPTLLDKDYFLIHSTTKFK